MIKLKRSRWSSSACGLLMLLSLGHVGCILDFDGDSQPGPNRVMGYYEAIDFRVAGPHDGEVDILANGGMLVVRLLPNHRALGHIVIPSMMDPGEPPTDVWFGGEFSLVQDTLRFNNTIGHLEELPFVIEGTQLETPEMAGRRSILKIVLTRREGRGRRKSCTHPRDH